MEAPFFLVRQVGRKPWQPNDKFVESQFISISSMPETTSLAFGEFIAQSALRAEA
jgi:hypothetical protein